MSTTTCTALMIINPPRPRMVKVNSFGGGAPAAVDIATHDNWYLAKKRDFKRQIFNSHPDRHRTNIKKYRELLRRYASFEREQRWWYAHWGLTPPKMNNVTYTNSTSFTRTRVPITGHRPCAATRIQRDRERRRSENKNGSGN